LYQDVLYPEASSQFSDPKVLRADELGISDAKRLLIITNLPVGRISELDSLPKFTQGWQEFGFFIQNSLGKLHCFQHLSRIGIAFDKYQILGGLKGLQSILEGSLCQADDFLPATGLAGKFGFFEIKAPRMIGL